MMTKAQNTGTKYFKTQNPDMHKTQIKHKLPKTQNTNPFVLSDVCAFGLYLCFV